jgi:uncharacterized metal-binding protein
LRGELARKGVGTWGGVIIGNLHLENYVEEYVYAIKAGQTVTVDMTMHNRLVYARGKKLDKNIAVNGCEIRCATKSLQRAGLSCDKDIVVTADADFGLKKTKNLKDEEGLESIKAKVRDLVEKLS